jgi:hypothetical protein
MKKFHSGFIPVNQRHRNEDGAYSKIHSGLEHPEWIFSFRRHSGNPATSPPTVEVTYGRARGRSVVVLVKFLDAL